ncbi:SAM-dependent methyltransferase [Vibrio parahaemolyticus]|uniref:SAM-dependent methyltransferase n=1 Tax=Vibrio parahaemolyticus TaxID=670 RepID=UPI001937101B|nr:cyclopropane-fatty-acyl-phospholipid synthase family protein [Vibrio parahaemolyticus]EHK4783881.1 class I SAM-dependent methyltransferase [Vibrio parahaemolyticus]EJO4008547.1 class I SAM-dependent methyltransferase [Vibrio parahaemolyticus]MBM4988597.1 class I SAM-dependent methyltransferase [Vibrio parahaemolyticus]MBM4992708.1 class I SAM-dependent methyltransferase [Vibrio parahaemolyticus]MCG6486798.1 cyclopropane-fatty-acyl-phospholipid synthase family protein [Vibrio parahaemolyticu
MLNTTSIALPRKLTTQKAARGVIFQCLQKMEMGCLTIIESFHTETKERSERFTAPNGEYSGQPVVATIEVKHPGFYSRILQGGSIAAGEAYMDGWWDSPDLTALMKLMALNMRALDKLEEQGSWLTKLLYKFSHWTNRNSQENSRKNIHAHYDLGNDLYEAFLDTNMLYSSALYHTSADSLEQAQINKMERLCQQLDLQSTDHVIEIGTGWGAMAIYMAEQYGCRVTTTTISEEQHEYARQQIVQRGLADRITLLKEDYRNLTGKYDKLVSIEMIEAVGKQFLASYIKKCESLLKPSGLMAIQAITIADQRYDYYSNNVDFIQKYIFPGGFLPSVTSLTQATTKHSDLVVRDLFDIGLDYAKTLNEWHRRFNHAEDAVRGFGYDDRFVRMWRYYLSYCEGGFLARTISAVHMTFQRP